MILARNLCFNYIYGLPGPGALCHPGTGGGGERGFAVSGPLSRSAAHSSPEKCNPFFAKNGRRGRGNKKNSRAENK